MYVGENNRNIKIDKSITLIGKSKQNTIINGESCGRLFNVSSTGKLTLINLTFINGYTQDNGGSIYCDSGQVNIRNCIFKDSRADNYGGVIYNNRGTLNVENSCFTKNGAVEYGGVMYTLGKTSVRGCDFTENVLTSTWGVGACIASGGIINLEWCCFSNCFTPFAGGALVNMGNATVNNCRFENMVTNYTAAGISNHANMVINNSYFGYNDVQYYAAAILSYDPNGNIKTKVYNTIFEKNHAGRHGAVLNNYPGVELIIQNCAFIDNTVGLNRYGDIALDDNATVLYCWWASNEINPYYYSPHDGNKQPEKINASRWLIMTFTADNGVVYKNENNKLTVSLRHYFDNETKQIYDYNEDFNLPLEVTLFTDSGILATKKLVNGVATFDFNPQNVGSVYASINNQVLKLGNFQFRNTQIVVSDFQKYYGSSSKLLVKLVSDNNVAISNEVLSVSINGDVYKVKTDKNGIARLNLKNTPLKYRVRIYFNGEGYVGSYKFVKVKIVKPLIKASKLKIRKGRKFAVTFRDANKKPIKKVKVKFKIWGKTFISTTNSKGQAKFTINLKPGKYAIKVGFKNTAYYGTVSLSEKIRVVK